MIRNDIDNQKHFMPWAIRIFNKLPGSPLQIGLILVSTILLLFLSGRYILELGSSSSPGDLRLTIIHILLAAYSVSTYVYLIETARKVKQDLSPVAKQDQQFQSRIEQVGKHVWWGILLAGIMAIAVDIYATNLTTIGSDPWDWRQNSYDSFWMRFLGLFFSWYIGCSLYVLVVESKRLSRLTESIDSIDLLNLEPYKPLLRYGLTNALVVLGMASIFSLFLLEPGFGILMIQILTVLALFAWIGLMLPLTGIRKKIAIAKERELKWCRHALIDGRDRLKNGHAESNTMSEIVAYKDMVEGIRNWPFDNPTLIRFALYLLIPLGSMLGSALLERGLELLIP